ncbi:hypothetical protein MKW94_020363 [Papaver nudicaule]|uniref:Transferase, Chloramphenicol acetyltransferase-like domain protein n=1 Tax=Papaver nudicaule TaxID=74823 RepID=A0AA41VVD7_PAPNU|nr:hypothetical protein [Papaver nudicaule]
MKIEVVSKESIRPSSPTPDGVKTYNLSHFDQLLPPIYVPLLLYYSNLDSNEGSLNNDEDDNNMVFSASSRYRCDVLKKSLAETLTRYYPLAGRIKDEKSVECNDEEVSQIIQVAGYVNIDVMEPLLPFEPYGEPGSTFGLGLDLNSKGLLKIQVNVFDCGGIVICAYFIHKIADAASFVNFVNDWAATARATGDGCTHSDDEKPCYILSSLFPPISDSFESNHTTKQIKHETKNTNIRIVTKRFVFMDFNIAKLKKICIHDVNDHNQELHKQQLPTRFEALTSLIWKCFMDVNHRSKARQEHDADSSDADSAPKLMQYGVSISVNLRTRMIPLLPANTFGNMGDVAIAQVSHDLSGNNLYYPELVSKVKDAIKLINTDHVAALKSKDAISNMQKMKQKFARNGDDHESTVMLQFTSWSRSPVYEADFGWGKPIWASGSRIPIENMVMFMDTSLGDGIEAWVSLKHEDMVEFECHEELVTFAS